MQFIIISGRSGAGKSSVLGALEDLNFYCIDNLPVALIPLAVSTVQTIAPNRSLAVSIDIRTLGHPTDVPDLVNRLAKTIERIDIVYIDAVDETLARRFTETRRLHPLSNGIERSHLSDALALEKTRLEPILAASTFKIDSSGLSIHALRTQIKDFVSGNPAALLLLKIQSFGFKRGVPVDSDTVFDARALPNPHWEDELRLLTGQDQAIVDFLTEFEDTTKLCDEIEHHIRYWIPKHAESGRKYFTVSIGCTGGQHRSVYIAESITKRLADLQVDRQLVHRELSL